MGRPGWERPQKVLLGLIQFNHSPTHHEMANHNLRCVPGYMPQLSNHSSVSGDPEGHSLKLKLLDWGMICSEEGLGRAGTSTELVNAFCITKLRSSCLPPEWKSILRRQMLVEMESTAFNQLTFQGGRWVLKFKDFASQTQDSAQPWKFLKGKEEAISVNYGNTGSDSLPSPTDAGLLTPQRSYFRCYLVYTVCMWDYWRGI